MSQIRSAIIQPEILLIETFTEAAGTVLIQNHTPDYTKLAGALWIQEPASASIATMQIVAANDALEQSAGGGAFAGITLASRPSRIRVKTKQSAPGKTVQQDIILRKAPGELTGLLLRFTAHTQVTMSLFYILDGFVGTQIGASTAGTASQLADFREIEILDNGAVITVNAAAVDTTDVSNTFTVSDYLDNAAIALGSVVTNLGQSWDDLIVNV